MTVTALRFDRDSDCIECWSWAATALSVYHGSDCVEYWSSQWLPWGLIMGSSCIECWPWQRLHWVLIMTETALVLIMTVTALGVDHDSDCTECWSWQWLHWVLIMTATLLSVDWGQWWHLTLMNSDLWSVYRRGLHYVLKNNNCIEW